MNIFRLDDDPKICALYHCDRHLVKMILEHSQLMSTAHHVFGTKLSKSGKLYKQTHANHPSAVWVRESRANYKWLHELTSIMCAEYSYRYFKVHKIESSGLIKLLSSVPLAIPDKDQTPLRLAMPDECKTKSPVESYRNYYASHKERMLSWRGRSMPNFLKSYGYTEVDG